MPPSIYGADAESRICNLCKRNLPRDLFYKDPRAICGMKARCIECCTLYYRKPEVRDRKRISSSIAWRNKEKRAKREENKARWIQTFRGRLSAYVQNTKARGLDWLLSEEDFFSFWKKSCHYCGCAIETVGLDRVDNSRGYSMDNVVSCCTICNRMKLNHDRSVFLSHIKKIYERNLPCENSTETSSTLQKQESLMSSVTEQTALEA